MADARATSVARADKARNGRIGGLRRSALCPDNRAHTQPARDARYANYRDQIPRDIVVPPGSTLDAEIDRRAGVLRQADMIKLSQRAAVERKRAAEADAELAELDATGLPDCGCDGINLDA